METEIDATIKRIRRPVKRAGAEQHLLFMLLSFAAAVIVTREFLQLTGFPQLGNDEFHVAHVMWGGLLLFIASLLPLTLANRWVVQLASILSGVGVGLFIDEVGKFITQSNDYFYPAAAPIIYAFFLLSVLLYLRFRRRTPGDARSELYAALDHLTEVIDFDLDTRERAEIEIRLYRVVTRAANTDQARLARTLLDFLESKEIHLTKHRLTSWDQFVRQLRIFEARWLSRAVHRTMLVVGLAALGLTALENLLALALALISPRSAEFIGENLFSVGVSSSASSLSWFITRIGLEGIVGALLTLGAGLLFFKREERGLTISHYSLLLYLLTVNLIVLYFDQFTTIVVTLVQFGLLLGVMRYRQRFMLKREPVLALHNIHSADPSHVVDP